MEPKTEGNPTFQKSPRNVTPPLASRALTLGANDKARADQARGVNTDLPKGR